MTADVIARVVRTLRAQSLLAEALAWEAHLEGFPLRAAHYDYEADRLWARSEDVAKAEVVESATEARPC